MPAEDAIGLRGPEYEMDIERGKIREFAAAMNAPLPEFIDSQNPLIPATFLITAAYGWGYSLERPRGTAFEQLDHDLSVPLHAEESFTFHAALPRAGDRLICRATLENVWHKQGSRGGDLTFLTMLTEFRSEAGELIAEGVLAVDSRRVLRDLAESIHAHPTLSETLYEVANQLAE